VLCEQDVLGKRAEECRRPGGLELTRHALALCAFPEGARIVDIGCGMGASVRMLRTQGYACVGLDRTVQAGDFPQIRGRAEALPLARESLHGILCECVLSLLREPERVLKGFWDMCRFGGRLLLTDIYIKASGRAAPAVLFSRPELEAALRGAGWQVAHFEDCSRALKEFAAHLLWHAEGESLPWPQSVCGGKIPWRACGYGVWIARKEAS
jgi:SAM-dependent methyltransferase